MLIINNQQSTINNQQSTINIKENKKMTIVKTEIIDNRLHVSAPYNVDFIDNAKNLGGKWDGERKSWNFDQREKTSVSDMLVEIFGTDGDDDDNFVDVEVTMHNEMSEYADSVRIAGRVIARATGRDSGARLGNDIVFKEKKPQSGGSVKNWKTIITTGSVFEIRNLPIRALSILDEMDHKFTYKIITN